MLKAREKERERNMFPYKRRRRKKAVFLYIMYIHSSVCLWRERYIYVYVRSLADLCIRFLRSGGGDIYRYDEHVDKYSERGRKEKLPRRRDIETWASCRRYFAPADIACSVWRHWCCSIGRNDNSSSSSSTSLSPWASFYRRHMNLSNKIVVVPCLSLYMQRHLDSSKNLSNACNTYLHSPTRIYTCIRISLSTYKDIYVPPCIFLYKYMD